MGCAHPRHINRCPMGSRKSAGDLVGRTLMGCVHPCLIFGVSELAVKSAENR